MPTDISWGAGGLNLRGRNERFDRGMDRFEAGDYEQALNLLDQALEESDSDSFLRRMILFRSAEARVRLGKAALERGDSAEAQKHLLRAVELNPRYPDLHYSLALAKHMEGDLPGALESIDLAIEFNPVFARARVLRGAIHYALGQAERGITELESALRMDSSLSEVREALNSHLAGDFRAAQKVMMRSIQPSAPEFEIHQRQGEEHFRHGRYEEAAAEFLRALDISPAYADIHNRLGITLAAAGRKAQALNSFDRALEYNHAYIDALINRGAVLQELGRPADSAQSFQRALELDPENEAARERLQGPDAPGGVG